MIEVERPNERRVSQERWVNPSRPRTGPEERIGLAGWTRKETILRHVEPSSRFQCEYWPAAAPGCVELLCDAYLRTPLSGERQF